jgi:2-iminobutanoate/2-iminopropanoate deaminase
MNQRQQAASKSALLLLVALGITGCASIATKEVVATKEAPAAIGPYSQAIKFGNMLFLAGQISIDPKTNQLNTGSIEEQTKLVLDNLKAVLAANGMTMDDVVSTTVFLKDLNEFGKMNGIYGSYFKDKPPARATVQVARLPRDVLVEISAIAAK